MAQENSQENSRVKIEKETVQDFDEVHSIWHKTWLATYPNEVIGVTKEDINKYFTDRYTTDKIQELKDEVVNPKDGIHSFVAKVNGKVVGHFVFMDEGENDRLESIFILPEYQGRGIGTSFWKEVRNLFTKGKPIKVNVIEYNSNAIEFYKKLGFVEVDRYIDEDSVMPVSKTKLPKIEMEFIPQ